MAQFINVNLYNGEEIITSKIDIPGSVEYILIKNTDVLGFIQNKTQGKEDYMVINYT